MNPLDEQELENIETMFITRRTDRAGESHIEIDSNLDEDTVRSILSCMLTWLSLPPAFRDDSIVE